ncbi:phytanoyl-CoA dioxygenase family protein [Herbaspirillum sp. WGmk3]|uniref:phytanoyl-CoA dioxygenase family protein n=1 Tax=Herbaspirillum sp. WGmk3 TaxID=2919925 RepID=UPI00209083B7|nr:phytanoyl-CoA dioxygenase family protein [Herbaspirillum sp. WGmk3]MCO4859843.1 phytanoyl-CoA dioxygenase family protein [Herbaspirillum sp. WGmk3]
MNPALLRAAKEQYRRLGFACLPSLWSSAEIHLAISALDNIVNMANADHAKWREHVLWQSDIPVSQLASVPVDRLDEALKKVHIIGDVVSHSRVLKAMLMDARCAEVAAAVLNSAAKFHFSNATIRDAYVGCSCHWHRDWPNRYCTTKTGQQLRLLICLDGMEEIQGATRIIPGSHLWTQKQLTEWLGRPAAEKSSGEPLICPPGGMILLGPTLVHGAGPNQSGKPRRNLIAQWGAASEMICMESFESETGKSLEY